MSVSIMQLWMPILLGGFLAWIASALIHMVLKYHNSDFSELPNEADVIEAIGNPSPAMYTIPYCKDMKDMGNEAMQAKFEKGPVAILAIMPNGMPPMGKLLVQQILFFMLASVLIAYVASLSLAAGSDYMQVFRVVSAIGFLAFGWGAIPFSIWYGHPWSTTAKYLVDALIYGFIVAAMFAWLWPSVS